MKKYMEKYGEHKLCYVMGNKAYFTGLPLSEQWGDDWDDAPYEHNAGEPYCEDEDDIFCVYFETGNHCTEVENPSTSYTNSPYSVKNINAREVPWISYLVYDVRGSRNNVQMFAGITLEEFTEHIFKDWGTIYFPKEE